MKIDLFGPPRLIASGEVRQHSSRKAMALLAYLALRGGEPSTRQHLADLLWPDADADQARINLRQALAQVKSLLGPERSGAILTKNDQVALDVSQFEVPARAILDSCSPDLAARVAGGAGLLEGFTSRSNAFDTWAAAQRHIVETRLADTLEKSGSDRLAKEPAAAAQDLSLTLALDPFRETVHRSLMQALLALGRTADALSQYEKCRAVLKEHLGVEPDAQTRALAAHIRAARLTKPAAPIFETFTTSVSVFADGLNGTGFTEMHRDTAAHALQVALDILRGSTDANTRIVAVCHGQEKQARTLLARYTGSGLVVAPQVYRMFENWSPFCFKPAPDGSAAYYLLLDDMPRHRLQLAPTTSEPTGKLAPGLSVVVLPFRDQSPEVGRLNLGDVLSEEIIARLARFRLLKVAGPSASQTCRALGLSGEDIFQRLGAKYSVSGSVARIGDRLAITYTTTDLAENRVVHSDKFEGPFADLFAQQSTLIDRIASTLFNRTQEVEMDRLNARLTNDIGAYELYLSGLALHRRGGISTQNAHDAVRRFDEAIRLDPEFVRAHAYRLCAMSWYSPTDAEDFGYRHIDRLVKLDENDPEVHRIAGTLQQMSGNSDLAVAHLDKAVQLNPSDAYLLASSAVYRAFAGDGAGALRQIERAMEVDPFLPSWCVEDHGAVLYANEDYVGASRSLQRLPAPSPQALAYLAAAFVAQDDLASAAGAVAQIRHIAPAFSVTQFVQFAAFRRPGAQAALRTRLSQAGLC